MSLEKISICIHYDNSSHTLLVRGFSKKEFFLKDDSFSADELEAVIVVLLLKDSCWHGYGRSRV